MLNGAVEGARYPSAKRDIALASRRRMSAVMSQGTVEIDRRLAAGGAIAVLVAGMALAMMGQQWLPFQSRSEATLYKEIIEQENAEIKLRLANDEARIQKNEDGQTAILAGLADIRTNTAKIQQQLDDQHKATGANGIE